MPRQMQNTWILPIALLLLAATQRVPARSILQEAARRAGTAPIIDADHPLTFTNSTKTLALYAASASVTTESADANNTPGETLVLEPLDGEGEGDGEAEGVSSAASSMAVYASGGPIEYHRGGNVKTGDLNMYIVWYGAWDRTSAEDVATMATLTHLVKYISNSRWMDVNREYWEEAGGKQVAADGKLTYRGSAFVAARPGTTTLDDADLQEHLAELISKRKLPFDAEQGMLLVLTSKELGAQKDGLQFCKDVCGYHGGFAYQGSRGAGMVHYSFTGTMSRCYRKCSSFSGPYDLNAPNEPNADSMATILAHEIVEVVSDPDFDAWYDSQGNENADICIWRYSNAQYGRRADGSQYRYTSMFGGKPYLIQDNWSPVVGSDGLQQGCVGSL